MTPRAALFFQCAEAVMRLNKDGRNCPKVFQFPGKAPAAARQCGNIMPQISINPLHSKSVFFIVNAKDVLSRKDYVQISVVFVRAEPLCRRNRVSHSLNRSERFVPARNMTCYLLRLSACYGHYTDIFPCFRPRIML